MSHGKPSADRGDDRAVMIGVKRVGPVRVGHAEVIDEATPACE